VARDQVEAQIPQVRLTLVQIGAQTTARILRRHATPYQHMTALATHDAQLALLPPSCDRERWVGGGGGGGGSHGTLASVRLVRLPRVMSVSVPVRGE
jgi:hypothetical protein